MYYNYDILTVNFSYRKYRTSPPCPKRTWEERSTHELVHVVTELGRYYNYLEDYTVPVAVNVRR